VELSPSRRGFNRFGMIPPEAWIVLAVSVLALWLGFWLVPETHATLQFPLTLVLALTVGIGTALFSRTIPGELEGRLGWITFAFIPFGMVATILAWLSGVGGIPAVAALALALGVLLLTVAQFLERDSNDVVRGTCHAISIAVGYAIALRGFLLAEAWPVVLGVILAAAIGVLDTAVVLRGREQHRYGLPMLCAVAGLATAELAWFLFVTPLSPLAMSLAGVLALYAVSTTCHALRQGASPRAYVEVALVTVLATGAMLLLQAR
jgi:hypothetical protein